MKVQPKRERVNYKCKMETTKSMSGGADKLAMAKYLESVKQQEMKSNGAG